MPRNRLPLVARLGARLAARLAAFIAASVAATPIAWAADAALCGGQLSPAQQQRFRLLDRACQPAPAEPAPAWQRAWRRGADAAQADALLLTEAPQLPHAPLMAPPRESAHLQLYGGAGVVMARVGPAPVAASSSNDRQGARSSARNGARDGARTPARGAAPSSRPHPASLPRTVSTRSVSTRAVQLAPQVDAVARRHNIDPLLLHAVAHVESRHNSNAVSPAGARGLMQVMPATAARFGVKQAGSLHDAPTNLEVSAAYLKTLQARFGTNLTLVLAAYNAGEGAVERYGRRIPPFAETQAYVKQVLAKYQLLTDAARAQAQFDTQFDTQFEAQFEALDRAAHRP